MSKVSSNNEAIVLKWLLILVAAVGVAIIFFLYYGMLPGARDAIIIYALMVCGLLRSAIRHIFGRKN